MIANAYTFNPPMHQVCQYARELETSVQDLMVTAIQDINVELAKQRREEIEHRREVRRMKKINARKNSIMLERKRLALLESEDLDSKLSLLEKTMARKTNFLDGKRASTQKLSEKQRAQLSSELEQIEERHIPGLRTILHGETAAVFDSDRGLL